MTRRQKVFVLGITLLAAAGLGGTLAAGWEPLLGLDLQGGVSVRLKSVEPDPDPDLLDQTVSILRNRVDGLGVAEPEISRTGDGVLVALPGVDDADRALELVGTTAELRFRPVLRAPCTAGAGGACLSPASLDVDELLSTTTTAADATTTTGDASSTTTGDSSTTTVEPTTTTAPGPDLSELLGAGVETTPAADDEADATVVLPVQDENVPVEDRDRYELGPVPAGLTGDAVDGATARLNISWSIEVDLNGEGNDAFNLLNTECANLSPTCPTGLLAITLDGEVVIAPRANAEGNFDGVVYITRGDTGFPENEAKDVALAIRYGALPIELAPENTQQVSASVGKDALNAGVVAGIVGLILVAGYMILYYRALGVIAILSLAISSALLWTIISYLGAQQGLALTLAGVTGIVVSIGVSVDSNIVYFEHLKEDILNGRTARSAVDRAFPVAFSTIVKADVASLIGSVLLYLLSVGAVRGFALYLALATVLDLVATYFFMGPAVQMLARRKGFSEHPARYGLPAVEPEGLAT